MKKLDVLYTLLLIVGMVVLTVSGLVYLNNQYDVIPQIQPEDNLKSVTTGQEYNATTTSFEGGWSDQPIKGGWGSLGSIIVTKAGDLEYFLLNATTSLDNMTENTSTVTLANIPANLAAGTYVFDITFNTGLYLDVISGDNGTSTITFR